MTRMKICGLSRACDIEYANRCRPDYIGFVFAKSRRQVTPEQARELRAMLSPCIIPVGVFVNAPVEQVVRLLKEGVIGIAQLHGQESPDEIRAIQKESGCPVIKAFSVKGKEDILEGFRSPADYLLFDCGTGGTGRCFDWKILTEAAAELFEAGAAAQTGQLSGSGRAALAGQPPEAGVARRAFLRDSRPEERPAPHPFFLAGGISPENVETAIRAVRPYAVDVSSGVETGGFKDPEKMYEFVRRVRNVER